MRQEREGFIQSDQVKRESEQIDEKIKKSFNFKESRMSINDKVRFVRENHQDFIYYPDFVSAETYRKIFETLEVAGKTILNVGAGYSVRQEEGDVMLDGLLKSNQTDVTLLSTDLDFKKSKSWLLFDNKQIKFKPVVTDVLSLPFEHSSIDGYVSVNLVNDSRGFEVNERDFIKKSLLEALRVLKVGGFIIINSYGYFSHMDKNGNTLINNDPKYYEGKVVKAKEILNMVTASGFSHVVSIPFDTRSIDYQISLFKDTQKIPHDVEVEVKEACAYIAFKSSSFNKVEDDIG